MARSPRLGTGRPHFGVYTVMMRRLVPFSLLLILAGVALVMSANGARSDYLSVVSKFNAIEERKTKPGQRIALTATELNEYVKAELPKVAPQGIRAPSVELIGNNGKEQPNWVLRKLLDGERDVTVRAEVRSGSGEATVHLQRVEVNGVPLEGTALDFVMRNYVLPKYPDAKVERPFYLRYGMERLEVQPGVAYVVMKR
jgi:hypothetical protein